MPEMLLVLQLPFPVPGSDACNTVLLPQDSLLLPAFALTLLFNMVISVLDEQLFFTTLQRKILLPLCKPLTNVTLLLLGLATPLPLCKLQYPVPVAG